MARSRLSRWWSAAAERRPGAGRVEAPTPPAPPAAAPTAGGGHRFPAACYAPFTSLHLEPNGNVKACCMNQWHSLGNVATATLREIWDGEPAQQLRAALAVDDLSLGCEQCASHIERGTPEAAQLQVFDQYRASGPEPAWPVNLELALSNTCNLQCVMCNGELSSSIRSQRERRPALPDAYDEAFFAELDEFLPHLRSVTFLGGEPFLARSSLRVMERLVALGLRPACSVITNGTQLNDRVRRLVQQLPMHVSVSVDALTAETLESIRVGVDRDQLVANVTELRALTRAAGGGLALSFSLMRQNWQELGAVLAWADELDCDVFVVKVFDPGRFSLHHASAEQIGEVLAALEAEDRTRRPALGRNRQRWVEQVDWVRGLARRRPPAPTAVPVAIGAGSTAARRPAEGPPPDGVLHTDGDLFIRSVEPPDLTVAGVRFGDLVGATMVEAQTRLVRAHGNPRSTAVRYDDHGGQEIDLAFGPPGAGAAVQASLAVDDEGRHHWSFRTVAEAAGVEPADPAAVG